MEEMIHYAIIFAAVYLFASIPWGFIIGKMHKIDIREHGSGNIGATNVTRVLGKKWGKICFFLDFFKGLMPVIAVSILKKYGLINDVHGMALPLTVLASIGGHVWSIYLGFKGGKGMAVSAGAIVALAPVPTLFCGAIWAAVFYMSRYVSLASITAAVILPVSASALSRLGIYEISIQVEGLLYFIAVLVVLKHLSNIKRLINGTENRFEKKSEKQL